MAENKIKSGIWSTERVSDLLKEYEKTGVLPIGHPFFLGDIRLRKARINFKYTKEETLELGKVQRSVIYFAENFAKVTTDEGIKIVKLRKYQTRVLKQFVYYKNNVWLASRQIGKSMSATNCLSINWKSVSIIDLIKDIAKKTNTINRVFLTKSFFYKLYKWSISRKKPNILNYFVELLSSIIILILEKIEYKNYKPKLQDETFHSYDTRNLNLNVTSHSNDTRKILMLHQCKRDYMYTITFCNLQTVTVSIDHPLMLEYNKNKTIRLNELISEHEFSFFNRTKSQLKKFWNLNLYVACNTSGSKKTKIMSIKRSFFKMSGYDITVDGDNQYYANDILVHNCVTFDTSVNIYDPKVDKKQPKPIFELYYNNLKNKNFLDKIEYFILRILYKLNGRH